MNINLFNTLAHHFGKDAVCIDGANCFSFNIICPPNNQEGLKIIKLYEDDPNVFVGTNAHNNTVTSIQAKTLENINEALEEFITEFVGDVDHEEWA